MMGDTRPPDADRLVSAREPLGVGVGVGVALVVTADPSSGLATKLDVNASYQAPTQSGGDNEGVLINVNAKGRLDSLGAYAVFESQLNGRTQRFVTIDVYGPPMLPRTGQLAEALSFTNQDPKVIIMGDFNTPYESVHFDPFRKEHLQDALTCGGRGFRESWFYGLPLLSLDHTTLQALGLTRHERAATTVPPDRNGAGPAEAAVYGSICIRPTAPVFDRLACFHPLSQ